MVSTTMADRERCIARSLIFVILLVVRFLRDVLRPPFSFFLLAARPCNTNVDAGFGGTGGWACECVAGVWQRVVCGPAVCGECVVWCALDCVDVWLSSACRLLIFESAVQNESGEYRERAAVGKNRLISPVKFKQIRLILTILQCSTHC